MKKPGRKRRGGAGFVRKRAPSPALLGEKRGVNTLEKKRKMITWPWAGKMGGAQNYKRRKERGY